MLKNFIKVALRNLTKHKGYSFINILGLAVGIAVCTLIFLYVSKELSYDSYHKKSKRIYRITIDHPQAHVAVTPSMISPTLQQLFPEVEDGVRLLDVGRFSPLVVRHGEKVFEERKIAYADSTLFDVFDFKMLAGDAKTALVKPQTVVITRDMAQRYFGNESPVGNTLEINDNDFEVTGVIENIPDNSHFKFDFFMSLVTRSGWSQLSDSEWRAANFYTYIVLQEGAEILELNRKVNDYISKQFSDNEFASALSFVFEPLEDIHLYSGVREAIQSQGDIRYIIAAIAIAILILIIACINYMNLATARSARRAREVGIRKVLGSERKRLIGQFYGESAFLTLLAIVVSVLLVELFLPWFSQLTGQALTIDYTSTKFLGMIAGAGIIVTLLAGSYPALMLSSFSPAAVLKGSKVTGGSPKLRKFLVVFQFAASIFLIISTMVIYKQINYMQQKELGYKQDNVLVLTAYNDLENRFDAFLSEMEQVPGFKGAALASDTPTSIRAAYGPDVEGIDEPPNYVANGLRITPEFTEALNINIVAGRAFTQGDFTRANQSENREYAVLINESAAADFGTPPEELIGRRVQISGESGPIVGVIEDFHFSSLHQPIEPLYLFPRASFNKLLISFNTSDVSTTLNETRAVWNKMFPQLPFEHEFLDQEYNALYQQETRAGNIFTSFAILAIFVACLGLVGLASFMVEQRTQEIGVRKVLGATATQVMALFSKDFVVLVLIGFLIAVPVAWYTMSKWLQNFAYQIELQWFLFLIAGLVTILIAVLTVSWQAIKAARLDPAKSLRSE
ncbi:MAG: ABC transporter permease [Balneolaceae bacterium]|nr:ABC transporter permease [Balneolaceae bacterium]